MTAIDSQNVGLIEFSCLFFTNLMCFREYTLTTIFFDVCSIYGDCLDVLLLGWTSRTL